MLTQKVAPLFVIFRTEAEWLKAVAGGKKTRTFSTALTKARANNFYLGTSKLHVSFFHVYFENGRI